MMDWRKQVPGCFGSDDNKFALHTSEAASARAMVEAAQKDGASREDVVKEIVYEVYKRSPHASIYKEHLDEQVRELNRFWPV